MMELLSVQDSSGQLRYSSVLVKAGNPSQFYAESVEEYFLFVKKKPILSANWYYSR